MLCLIQVQCTPALSPEERENYSAALSKFTPPGRADSILAKNRAVAIATGPDEFSKDVGMLSLSPGALDLN